MVSQCPPKISRYPKEFLAWNDRINAPAALLAALLIVAIVALTMGSSPAIPPSLTARGLTIVDGQNRPRIVLETADEGSTSLIFKDVNGRDHGVFVLQADLNMGLNLKDMQSRDRLSIAVLPDGNPLVQVRDVQGTPRQILSLGESEVPAHQKTSVPPDFQRSAVSPGGFPRQEKSGDDESSSGQMTRQEAVEEYDATRARLQSMRRTLALCRTSHSDPATIEEYQKNVDDLQGELEKAQEDIDKAQQR